MNEINTLLLCLHGLIDNSTLRQLQIVGQAMLTMTGRVTILGISRWTEKGGSYRTIQRFFHKNIPWELLNWAVAKIHLAKCTVILIAGDATTVTKSGKETYGLGRFFSSIYSRAVPGIAFQCLSLIDVSQRTSWPIFMEQMHPKPKGAKTNQKTGKANKRGKGRPRGSKNKNRKEVTLNAEMTQVQSMLRKLIELIGDTVKPVYFVYDGAFGNNAAAQMTRQVGLHLISKLRNDSALYYPWDGKYSGKGKPKIYGDRIDFDNISDAYLKNEKTEDNVLTKIYQISVRHKKFSDLLNVVILLKKNLKTGKNARIILYSTDLNLEWDNVIDYYRLRFQIEFNFRDAKQHWGLEDFMVTSQQPVSNSAHISMWMINLSQALLAPTSEESILDLKVHYHGLRYAREVFKILPKNVQPINIEQVLQQVSALGRIHEEKMAA